jgi:ABC-type uncharacterized transport system permease subunit
MHDTLLHAATALYLLSILATLGRFAFRFPERAARAAGFALAWAGALLHAAALAGLALAERRIPADGAAEILALLSLLAVGTYLALVAAKRAPWMGMAALPPAMALLFASPYAWPFAPPLEAGAEAGARGPLFFVHTGLVALSVLLLLGHVVASLLYIAQASRLKAKHVPLAGSRLPSLDACDRAGLRALEAGFAALTLGILTGALEAAQARGHFFAWKAPEVFGLLTWFIFGALLEARLAHGWRGRKPAALSLAGFAILMAVLAWLTLA